MTLSANSARKLLESHDFMAKRIVEEYEKHDGRTFDEILFDVKQETRGEFLELLRTLNETQEVAGSSGSAQEPRKERGEVL